MSRTPEQEKTCEASGRFTSSDPLVAFLYDLMKLHLPTGDVAQLVYDATATRGKACEYTNGWLAQYAQHLSGMLRPTQPPPEAEKPAPKPGLLCGCGNPECGGCYPP